MAVLLLVSAPLPASARAVEGSTHLSVSTTDAKGHVGDTVSIRVTVTNHGPAVEPEWALTGVQTQEGTRFAAGTGCRPDPDGGQYCSSPGPLAVGKSQTVVLRYKIVKTVPHPEWEMGTFSFYEALDRKGGTDDVDLYFHISILGTAKPSSKPSATRTPTSTGRSPAARRTASPPPSRVGTTSASEPAAMQAAPETDPTPSLTAGALPNIEDTGFTANATRTAWAVTAGGIAVIGSSAFVLLARARRRRARAAASDIPEL
ncbi:hypothetical protein [Paractinoplanes globisporus]|uniref:hypothetical protein n=1 Tax=Paractinoplanes globisporus TaxID=113565 RepID=UPI0012F70FB3|nr:hypothetical protein [Actinoplanes globisporus]